MSNRIGPVVLALLLSGVAVLAFGATDEVRELCATCHEEVVKNYGKTVHGRAATTATCTTCHIGAQEHAESGGEKKPVSLEHGEQADNPCLSCHGGKKNQAHWEGSAHEMANIGCGACHDVHKNYGGTPQAKRAVQSPGDVTQKCLSCHGSQRAMLNQRSAHPLRQGQMECSSCHNPHGTSNERLLRQGSVNELCHSCHQNFRGPFLWEHSPAREDCLTCHRAHGSNYPQLLQARVPQLCQSCHQQGRHQTVPGVPNSIWVASNSCVNCHSQVHGSNHPSGPLFQR